MLDGQTMTYVRDMLGVKKDEDIPHGLLERLERVNTLCEQGKPCGALLSAQAVAVVVEGWERDRASADPRL